VRVSDKEGQVMEVTWRTTRLLTRENDYIYLPNRLLADGVLENYTFPTPLHVIEVEIGASYNDPPDQVRAELTDIALSTVSVLPDPAPEVWITGYGDSSIKYRLRAWVDDFRKVYSVRSEIYSKIWYAFRRSGIEVPYPSMNVIRKTGGRVHERDLIRRSLKSIDFLQALTDGELDRVEASARIEVFGKGEAIVTEGEAGSTCYFLRSGRAEVYSKGQNGRESLVTTLGPGGFFGEMSLLTGEPRSATIRAAEESVCIVIDSDVFHSIFREDPELSERLSELLSRRAGELKEARERFAEPPRTVELRESILSRIKQFFKV
ncbi:MAG: cyclic nucleotide-binding domain-containing protein, partial [Deltaproteobacteria bacterium]|nr:cyclic nucleotide-binding domain-containing protein [Deltaproteobacteria bacterium]